jgi:hypothetical protein
MADVIHVIIIVFKFDATVIFLKRKRVENGYDFCRNLANSLSLEHGEETAGQSVVQN